MSDPGQKMARLNLENLDLNRTNQRLRAEIKTLEDMINVIQRELSKSHGLYGESERELAKSHAALNDIRYVVENSFEQLRRTTQFSRRRQNTTEFPTTEFSRRAHTPRRPSSDGP